jgi:fructokinase
MAQYQFEVDWNLPVAASEVRAGVHLHTGSIGATLLPGADAVLDAVRAVHSSSTISYDPNLRPSVMGPVAAVRTRVETLVSLTDVVKASEEDIAWLYPNAPVEEVLAEWHCLGPTVCIATRGADPAIVTVGGVLRRYPARPAIVADTVGAGDSFMAGMLSGLLDLGLLGGVAARRRLAAAEADIESAIERALACAAVTVARAGANPPRRHELQTELDHAASLSPYPSDGR